MGAAAAVATTASLGGDELGGAPGSRWTTTVCTTDAVASRISYAGAVSGVILFLRFFYQLWRHALDDLTVATRAQCSCGQR